MNTLFELARLAQEHRLASCADQVPCPFCSAEHLTRLEVIYSPNFLQHFESRTANTISNYLAK